MDFRYYEKNVKRLNRKPSKMRKFLIVSVIVLSVFTALAAAFFIYAKTSDSKEKTAGNTENTEGNDTTPDDTTPEIIKTIDKAKKMSGGSFCITVEFPDGEFKRFFLGEHIEKIFTDNNDYFAVWGTFDGKEVTAKIDHRGVNDIYEDALVYATEDGIFSRVADYLYCNLHRTTYGTISVDDEAQMLYVKDMWKYLKVGEGEVYEDLLCDIEDMIITSLKTEGSNTATTTTGEPAAVLSEIKVTRNTPFSKILAQYPGALNITASFGSDENGMGCLTITGEGDKMSFTMVVQEERTYQMPITIDSDDIMTMDEFNSDVDKINEFTDKEIKLDEECSETQRKMDEGEIGVTH